MSADEEFFNSKPITLEDLNRRDGWYDAPMAPTVPVRPLRAFFHIDLNHVSLQHGSDVEMAKVIAFEVARDYGEMIFADGEFWVFEDTMWKKVPEPTMRRAVHGFDGTDVSGGKKIKLGSGAVSGIIRECAAVTSHPEFFDDPTIGLNARNGVVTIGLDGKITTRPHMPDDRHRFTIEADYRQSNSAGLKSGSLLNTLLTGAFLGDIDAADKINLVGELLGAAAYGLATRLPQPKACIFLGETASNGKSTIASLISVLLPPNATSSIPLSAFSDERRIVNLAGKAANVADELSGSAIQGEQFKAAVTGDPIEGRDVYKSALTFRPRALQICTTNILPHFAGGLDRGLQRRLIVLPFFRTIPENEIISDISERIRAEEMDLLLDFAVQGAARLVINKGYTIPKSSVEALNEWLMKDPVFGWFSEKMQIEDDYQMTEWLKIKELFDSFKAWCVKEDIPEKFTPSRENFSIRLCRQKGVHKRRVSTGAEVRGFIRKPNNWA